MSRPLPRPYRRDALALSALLGVSFAAAAAPTATGGPAAQIGQACLGCHGADGRGGNGVPGVVGREAAELTALMRQFRAGERPATIMTRITRGYTEAEIDGAVAWLAAGAGAPR